MALHNIDLEKTYEVFFFILTIFNNHKARWKDLCTKNVVLIFSHKKETVNYGQS